MALYVMTIIFTGVFFALERVQTVDYNSINGDFQSYNVFRRVLDGQTPYLDFTNYIGFAPIAINIPLLLFDSTFSASLFVTNLTANIVFSLSVLVILFLITKNLYISCFVSALIPKFISTGILTTLIGAKYGYIWTARFADLFTPSNSMRGTRSFLPFLFIIIVFIAIFLLKRYKNRDVLILDELTRYKSVAILGVLFGAGVVWSNDFGFACVAAFVLILLTVNIFYAKAGFLRLIKLLLIAGLSVMVGLLFITTIITNGNPTAWLSATLSTAEYQFFYFNGSSGMATLPYIFTNLTLWLYTLPWLVMIAFHLYRLIKGKAKNTDVALVFIALSVVIATFAYVASGSGYNFREAIEVYLVIFAIGYCIKAIDCLLKERSRLLKIAGGTLLLLLCGYNALQIATFSPIHAGSYYPELGGYSTFDKALAETSELIGDEQIFSTYATGVEVVTGQFQPTGSDYIIHALGKEVQQDYVDTFVEGEYRYAQTPSMSLGGWLANQNWYFYRELLANYERVYSTEYSHIWERTEPQYIDAKVEFTLSRIDDSSYEIICTSEYKGEFIADFNFVYKTEFRSILSKLSSLGRTSVRVGTNIVADDDSYSGLLLPSEGEAHFPIEIRDGIGSTIISTAYSQGAELEIESVEYIHALPMLYLGGGDE